MTTLQGGCEICGLETTLHKAKLVRLVFVFSLIIGTKTEKMLLFVLPILEKLSAEGSIRNYQGQPLLALTMTPTRELAIQVFRK